MTKNDKKEAIDKIKKYKEYKADIVDIEIQLREIEEDVGSTERTGKTYKIVNDTENQAERLIERKEKLNKDKKDLELRIARIDNALTVLEDEEKEIIQMAHIENKKYWKVQDKMRIGYQRVKQIEDDAIKKMIKYI